MTTKTKTALLRSDIAGKFLRPDRLKETWAKMEKNDITAETARRKEAEKSA